MPTWIPGTDSIVSFDNSSAVLTDQSDYISTVALDFSGQVSTFYTFGLSGAQKSEGQGTWSGSMGIRPATDAGGAHLEAIDWITPSAGNKPGARTLQIQEPDAASGSVQWDGEIYAVDYNAVSQDADSDGVPAVRTLSFEVDGQPTKTIIS